MVNHPVPFMGVAIFSLARRISDEPMGSIPSSYSLAQQFHALAWACYDI